VILFHFTADGSLTMIIVPAVVGTFVVLFLIGFVYARMTNKCQASKRSHDEVDLERGFSYIRPGKGFAEMHRDPRPVDDVDKQPRKIRKKKRTKKRRRNFRRVPVKLAFRDKLRLATPGSAWRAKLQTLRIRRWKSGPKRVVGVPDGVGVSSVCGDPEFEAKLSETASEVNPSSSARATSASSEQELDSSPQNDGEIKTSGVKESKVPPPRPPAPKITKKRTSSKTSEGLNRENKVLKKNGSSGYSSAGGDPKRRSHKTTDAQRVSKKKSKDVSRNPYDNYPVAATDRKYLDFENDYRKRGHIYEAGAYHPQYHPVETFPMKPAHRKTEDTHSRQDKNDQQKEAGDKANTTGGVKYYSIKPCHDEGKTKKRHKHRSGSPGRKKGHGGRHHSLDREETERKRRKHERSRRRKERRSKERHESSHKRKRRSSSKKYDSETDSDDQPQTRRTEHMTSSRHRRKHREASSEDVE